MTPTTFILVLNPVISAIFAVALFVLWQHQRHLAYVLPLVTAFLFKTLGYACQFVTLPELLSVSRLLSNVFFLSAAILFVGGLISRFGARPPYRLLVTLGLAAIAVLSWFLFVEPNYAARVVAVNVGLAAILLLGALRLHPLARGNLIERVQALLLALYGLVAIIRFLPLTLPGAQPTRSIDSTYWLSVTGSDVVLSTLLVLSIFAGIALDVVAKLRSESTQDALSGLLNRRGFEECAAARVGPGRPRSIPAALILADLDHFKSINDTWGHATGDRVIVAFARELAAAAGPDVLVGRLGGEEFGVLLPGANASVALLLAARVKSGFSDGAVPGLPAEARPTASFGIAEIAAGESLEAAMLRADEALYRAKDEGRDRIRLAGGAEPELIPRQLRLAQA